MAAVKLASRRVLDLINRQYLTAKIVQVDFDRVDVIPQGSSGILRGVPLVGDPEAVVPGDTVLMANYENGKRVAFCTGEQSGSRNVRVSLSVSGSGGGGTGLPSPGMSNSILLSDGEHWVETTLESLGLVDAVELGMILLYASGQAVRAYSFTAAGFDQALAAAAHGNVVFVPGRDLAGNFTLPAGIFVECNGTRFLGQMTLSDGCSLGGATLARYGSGGTATAVTGPMTGAAALRDCYLLATNDTASVETLTLNGGALDLWNCIVIADAHTSAFCLAVAAGTLRAYGCDFQSKTADMTYSSRVVKQHTTGDVYLYHSKLCSTVMVAGAEAGVEELAPTPTSFTFTGMDMELPSGMTLTIGHGAASGDKIVDGGDGGRSVSLSLRFGRSFRVTKASAIVYAPHYNSRSITYRLGGAVVREVAAGADAFPIDCDEIIWYASSFSTGGPTSCYIQAMHAEYETTGASAAAFTYGCQMKFPSGIPMRGDLGAFDAERFPHSHANDVGTGEGIHHWLGEGYNDAARGSHSHAIDNLSDVDLTTNPPATKNALVYNGTDWVPGPSGHVVQNEGGDMPLRDYLDFLGEVLVEDVPAQNKTRVTFPAITAPGERLYANRFLSRPTGTLLRRYTFDSGIEGWTSDKGSTLTTTSDGFLKFVGASGQDCTALEPLTVGAISGNFEASFTLRISSTGQDIAFHYYMQDFNNGYMLTMRAWHGSATLQFYRKSGGSYVNLGSGNANDPLFRDTTVRVLVRVVQGRVSVYMNDRWMVSHYDTTYTSGYCGFRVYSNASSVEINDLEIYTIPASWNIEDYARPQFVGYTAGHKLYQDTKQNILALETPDEGGIAVTTDTEEMGFYLNGEWHWTQQRPLLDGYLDLSEIPKPAAPGSDMLRLYARDVDDVSRMFVQRPDGSEVEILSGVDNTGLMVKKKMLLVWEPIVDIDLTEDAMLNIDLPDTDYKLIWGFGKLRQSYNGAYQWTRWRVNDVPFANNNYLTYYHHGGSGHGTSGQWDDLFGYAPGVTSGSVKFEEFEVYLRNANTPGLWKYVDWRSNAKWGTNTESSTYLWQSHAYWLNTTDRMRNLKIMSYDRGVLKAGSCIALYGLRLMEVVTDVYGDPENEVAWELADLADVDVTANPPVMGDVLVYDGTKWVAGPVESRLAVPEALNDLGDAQIVGPRENEVLMFRPNAFADRTFPNKASITATTSHGLGTLPNALDGVVDDLQYSSLANQAVGMYVQFDFGRNVTLVAVKQHCTTGPNYTTDYPRAWKILGSNTGDFSGEETQVTVGTAASAGVLVTAFPPATFRYWRITLAGGVSNYWKVNQFDFTERVYNGAWENRSLHAVIPLDGLSDVAITSIQDGDILQFSTSAFTDVPLTDKRDMVATASHNAVTLPNALDGFVDASQYTSGAAQVAGMYVQFDFGRQTVLRAIGQTCTMGSYYTTDYPRAWQIVASNTGAFTGEETQLATGAAVAAGILDTVISSPQAFQYYRIVLTAGVANHWKVNEFTFTERVYRGDWVNAPASVGGASALGDLTDVDVTTTPPVAGNLLYWDGTKWVPATTEVLGSAPKAALLMDEKPSGTASGTLTAGAWQTRTLNTVRQDGIGVVLANNQFTLPAGKYRFNIPAQAMRVNRHGARLWNVTDNTTALVGTSAMSAAAGSDGTSQSLIVGCVTLTKTTTFEVQHRCESTYTTNAFGFALGFGEAETFLMVEVTQLG